MHALRRPVIYVSITYFLFSYLMQNYNEKTRKIKGQFCFSISPLKYFCSSFASPCMLNPFIWLVYLFIYSSLYFLAHNQAYKKSGMLGNSLGGYVRQQR